MLRKCHTANISLYELYKALFIVKRMFCSLEVVKAAKVGAMPSCKKASSFFPLRTLREGAVEGLAKLFRTPYTSLQTLKSGLNIHKFVRGYLRPKLR